MQLLVNIFVFVTFFMVPFLGGNHLPLYYLSIDRFWIEGFFGLFLICGLTFSFLNNKEVPAGFFKYLVFFFPILAFSAISLLYSWNSYNTVLWISVLVWAIGCVYLYAICPDKDVCLTGLITGAAFLSISAILQLKVLFPNLLTTFQHGLNAQILREQSGIPFASYMYHNILGGYLAFIFPLALYFATYKKSILSLGAAALIATGVVITSTRIGMGIILLSFLVAAIILVVERRKMELVKVGLTGMIAVMLVWVVLYQEGGRGSEVMGAKSVITQKTKAISADLSTLNTRTDIWKNAYNAFTYSPVAGFGAGSFEYAYRKYFDGNSYTGVAHSTLVKIAVELGIIGLFCFIFYLAGTGFVSKSLLKESRYLFLFLSFCAGFLFSLVDFSFDVKAHMLTFYLLSSTFFFPVSNSFKSSKNKGVKTLGFGTFFALTVCLLVNLVFTNRVNEFRTSIQNGDLLMETGLPVNALYPYRDATETMPLSTEGYARALSVLLQVYPGEAKQQTKEAMAKEVKEYISVLEGRRNKDSEVYFVLGKSYALMGDIDKADKYFRIALDFYPSSGYYVYEIASYYARNGDYGLAIKTIRSFDPYIEKHRGPNNPRGGLVYKIRDLEAELEFSNGNGARAVHIARNNLQDARNGVYMSTSAKSRIPMSREVLLKYLEQKLALYEKG